MKWGKGYGLKMCWAYSTRTIIFLLSISFLVIPTKIALYLDEIAKDLKESRLLFLWVLLSKCIFCFLLIGVMVMVHGDDRRVSTQGKLIVNESING